MARKAQMTKAQMGQVASMYQEAGYIACVTPNARHVIAIKEPAWLADMKKALAA